MRRSKIVWTVAGRASQSSQAESVQTDNVGNGVSGRVGPDETRHTDRYHRQARWPLLLGNFIFFHQEAMNAEAESKSGFPHFISMWPTKWGDDGGTRRAGGG